MFGFFKKKESEEDRPVNPLAPPEGPKRTKLKLRGPGDLTPPPPTPKNPPADATPGAPPPKKPKLTLMTQHEEQERSYQAAREHALNQSLPNLKKERQTRIRTQFFNTFVERIIMAVLFFLLVIAALWIYNHTEIVDDWWKSFLDGIKIL